MLLLKVCKEPRGLKMHQRSCRIINDLEDELQHQMKEILSEKENEDNINKVNPLDHLSTCPCT